LYLNNYAKIFVNVGVTVEKGDLIKMKFFFWTFTFSLWNLKRSLQKCCFL